MVDLHEAMRRNTLATSQSLLSQDQCEQAVSRVEAGLRELPGDPSLQSALVNARHAAAESLHHRALAAADQAQLDAARTDLQKALQYEPQHAASLEAMQSLTHPDALPPAAQEAHAAIRQAMAGKHWQQAASQLAGWIARSPNDLPARADAYHVSAQIAQTRAHYQAAREAAGDKQLEPAIAELKAALAIWPDHAESLALMNQMVDQLAQATQAANAGLDHLAKHEYDQAIASARQALEVYPTYGAALKLESTARQSAADDAVAAGVAARDQRKYAEANAAFRKALGYQPKMPEAKAGLASVANAQAEDALRAGRVGLSVLYRMAAVEQEPSSANRRLLETARQASAARGAFALVIDGRNADAKVTADTVPFAGELQADLRRSAPAAMAVNPTPLPKDRPVFTAAVAVVRAEVSRVMSGQQQLVQTYIVQVQVPNPQIPELRECAHQAREAYEQQRRRLERASDDLADFKKKHDPAEPDYQKHLVGLQRTYNDAKRDEGKADRAARSAADDLKRAPLRVTAQQTQQWPYVRQHFTQTASVVATMTLSDAERHMLAAPISVSHEVVAEDDVTLQPNPEVGVPADALALPEADAMQRQAISEAAAKAAGKLLDAAIRTRAANLLSQAEELKQAGDQDRALELRVTAALLTQNIDAPAADKQFAAMRQAVVK